MSFSIPRFSVENSILANMITIVVVVWGVLVAVTMQREVFPNTDLDWMYITTVYPSASPEEVEDLITNLIEEELREIEEIDEVVSTSAEGLSAIVLKLDEDAPNKDRVINEVQQKVDQVDDLPEEAEDPVVEAITTDEPVVRVCVGGQTDEQTIRSFGEYLRTTLERIDGVSTVVRDGWRDEQFQVLVDLDMLHAQELSLSDVVAALSRRNVNLPGGKFMRDGEEVILRTVGKFHDAEEIANVVIRSNPDGRNVRVRDVGSVQRAFEEDDTFAKANGYRALILGVKKKGRGDTIDIVDEVRAMVLAEQERAPEGMALSLIDDQAFYVKRRLNVLGSNGLIGIVLVTACLFMALNLRVAFFTAFGIPFAFLATLVVMAYFGMTINLMTMFGMIIVLGMVVDDAIIVGENVFRHLEEGMPPAQAAIQGSEEVMKPVLATILTTIAAFIPLAFAPDVYATYLGWLVWVVVIALLASLVEVLFVLPSHLADFSKQLKYTGSDVRQNRAVGQTIMRKLTDAYRLALDVSLRFRYVFLVFVLAGFCAAGWLTSKAVEVNIFPKDLIDLFFVRVTAPQGTPLQDTEAILQQVEEQVRAIPDTDLDTYVTHVGRSFSLDGSSQNVAPHYGQVIVYLTPQNTRERGTETIKEELRLACSNLQELAEMEFEMANYGPPVGKPFEIKIRGREYESLLEISADIQAFLATQPGAHGISDDFEEGKQEMHVMVREHEAARLGLTVADIARTVSTAVDGAEATVVREGKEELEVQVQLLAEHRNPQSLQRLLIPNRQGRLIELGRVAQLVPSRGLPAIRHHDGDRTVTVGAFIDEEKTSSFELNLAVEEAFRDVPLKYPGCQLISAGEWKETKKVVDFMIRAACVAGLLIYTILTVQFGSFLQPFILLVTIPLGMVGVLLALMLHGKPVSMMAMMGMVGLGGVVVNDAIVLVSFINDRRRAGVPIMAAIHDAGVKRFRPIVLTSVTTIAGLVPVIYGIGGYEPFIAPAAIALAYGLLFASFLTLLVVPVLYLCGNDVRNVGRAMIRRGPGPDRSTEAPR